MKEQVDVLLATYQGARYIGQQIDSILNQSYPFVHLWIRDDMSKDETPDLLKKIAARHPDRITLVPALKNLGVRGNFSELMQCGRASYIMFSDQDDVWLPHKIETSLKLMKQMEREIGTNKPLLVHTDLKVVDSALKEIAPSFWSYSSLDPDLTSLNRLLTQNNVTGCTMLLNRSLLNLSRPIPDEAIMHDWWIALVAAALGRIGHLPSPTILYRQHGSNDVGAKKYGLVSFVKEVLYPGKKKDPKRTHKQAHRFFERYSNALDPNLKEVIDAYRSLNELGSFNRKCRLIKYGFFKAGFLRNLHHLFIAN